MSLTLTKSNILTGNTITAADISQSIDAFTGNEAYDITLSGSFNMTGSHSSQNGYTGSLLGTASFSNSSSFSISSSMASQSLTALVATSSSFSETSNTSSVLIGEAYTSSSGGFVNGNLKMIAGVSRISTGSSNTIISTDLNGKIYLDEYWVTATPISSSVSLSGLAPGEPIIYIQPGPLPGQFSIKELNGTHTFDVAFTVVYF